MVDRLQKFDITVVLGNTPAEFVLRCPKNIDKAVAERTLNKLSKNTNLGAHLRRLSEKSEVKILTGEIIFKNGSDKIIGFEVPDIKKKRSRSSF